MQGTSEIKHRHPSTIGFRRQNYKQAEKRDFHFNVDKVLLFQFNFIHVFSIIRQEKLDTLNLLGINHHML